MGKSYVWKRDEPDFTHRTLQIEAEIRTLEEGGGAPYSGLRWHVAKERLGWLSRAQRFWERVNILVSSTVERALEIFREEYGWPDPGSY